MARELAYLREEQKKHSSASSHFKTVEASLEFQLRDANEQVHALKKEVESEQQQASSKHSHLEDEIKQLRHTASEQSASFSAAQADIARYRVALEEMQKDKANMIVDLGGKEREQSDLKTAVGGLTMQVASLREQLDTSKVDLAGAAERVRRRERPERSECNRYFGEWGACQQPTPQPKLARGTALLLFASLRHPPHPPLTRRAGQEAGGSARVRAGPVLRVRRAPAGDVGHVHVCAREAGGPAVVEPDRTADERRAGRRVQPEDCDA